MSKRFEYSQNDLINYISDNKTGIIYIATNYNDMTDMVKLLNKQDQRIAELEEQLKNCIRPKFKPNEDLFVIVGYKDETKSIEQYYIDEIVIRGNGKLIEYRDIEQEMVIGENNLLFATYEEAQEILDELSSTNGQNE
jgi:hypothetical protein